MPFIRINRIDGKSIDVNTSKIIQFYELGGNTRIDLSDNLSHDVKDSPRQLRTFIKKAEGLLEPMKEEISVEGPGVVPGLLAQGT